LVDHQKGRHHSMPKTLSIPQLQSDWFNLHDLDRAAAIRSIHSSGISIRQIAAQLHKSESSLRHILTALDAPAQDRILARCGQISTNELVRRSQAAGLRLAARHREEVELERARQIRKAADQICTWLAGIGLNKPNCEMIVDEVRRTFNLLAPAPPSPRASLELTVEQIIERTRPAELNDDSIDILNRFIHWLLRWTFWAFPDPTIRDHALDIALEKMW
jgi:lambda repressor-like predicted transcriptional regulator